MVLSMKISEEAKSPLFRLAVCCPCFPKDLELHHFIGAAAKAALELHVADQSQHVVEIQLQCSASPH